MLNLQLLFKCQHSIGMMRKWNVRTVTKNTEGPMRLDTAKVVKQGLFLVLIVSISLTTKKKWVITWPRSMLHHLPSNQRFAHVPRRNFRVTVYSNNIGEKSMERNNGKQVIRWQTWTRLWRRKGKMERNSERSWVLANTSWWIRR